MTTEVQNRRASCNLPELPPLPDLPDFCAQSVSVPVVDAIPGTPRIPTPVISIPCQCPTIKPTKYTASKKDPQLNLKLIKKSKDCCSWELETDAIGFECKCPIIKSPYKELNPQHKRSAPKFKIETVPGTNCCEPEFQVTTWFTEQYCRIPKLEKKGNFPIDFSIKNVKQDLDHCDWDLNIDMSSTWPDVKEEVCQIPTFTVIDETSKLKRNQPGRIEIKPTPSNECKWDATISIAGLGLTCDVPTIKPRDPRSIIPIDLNVIKNNVTDACDWELQLNTSRFCPGDTKTILVPYSCCPARPGKGGYSPSYAAPTGTQLDAVCNCNNYYEVYNESAGRFVSSNPACNGNCNWFSRVSGYNCFKFRQITCYRSACATRLPGCWVARGYHDIDLSGAQYAVNFVEPEFKALAAGLSLKLNQYDMCGRQIHQMAPVIIGGSVCK